MSNLLVAAEMAAVHERHSENARGCGHEFGGAGHSE